MRQFCILNLLTEPRYIIL